MPHQFTQTINNPLSPEGERVGVRGKVMVGYRVPIPEEFR
jgi:hypothetical protein